MEINGVGQSTSLFESISSLKRNEEDQKQILELGQELNQAKTNEKLSAENETGIQPESQSDTTQKDDQSKPGNLVDTFA